MRRHCLRDPGTARGPADDPPGTVAVQPPSGWRHEERCAGAFADGEIDRAGSTRREQGDDGVLGGCAESGGD
jgi:hypothetical protein